MREKRREAVGSDSPSKVMWMIPDAANQSTQAWSLDESLPIDDVARA